MDASIHLIIKDYGSQMKTASLFNWLINHPWLTLLISLILPVIMISFALYEPWVLLSENQILYIFSTQSQVLSAIYGLTLTGYIFLRNHQEREIEKDSSLYEIIRTIQEKEYSFLVMLTIASITAIIFDLLTLSMYLSEKRFLNIIIKNSATALFIISLLLISFFIIKALKADKYSEVSRQILLDEERKIGEILEEKFTERGGVENYSNKEFFFYGAFITNFVELEKNIEKLFKKIKIPPGKTTPFPGKKGSRKSRFTGKRFLLFLRSKTFLPR